MLLPAQAVLAALPAAVAARPLQRLCAVELSRGASGASPGPAPGGACSGSRRWELVLRAWTPRSPATAPDGVGGKAVQPRAAGSELGGGPSAHAPVYLLERAGGFMRWRGARVGDCLALAMVGGELRIEVSP